MRGTEYENIVDAYSEAYIKLLSQASAKIQNGGYSSERNVLETTMETGSKLPTLETIQHFR